MSSENPSAAGGAGAPSSAERAATTIGVRKDPASMPPSTDEANEDEQHVLDQERADEEREASFLLNATNTDSDAVSGSAIPKAVASSSSTTTLAAVAEPIPSTSGRKGRKSRNSTNNIDTEAADRDEAGGEASNKKARRATVVPPGGSSHPDIEQHTAAQPQPQPQQNVRLDRLRQALEKFLNLIDHKASSENIRKALPRMDVVVVEALRSQFLDQLKASITEECEKLISDNQLDLKLDELRQLVLEADQRYLDYHQHERGGGGKGKEKEELKDVWRKNLDIETAISARAIPGQEERISVLKSELQQIQRENDTLHKELLDVVGRYKGAKFEANECLNGLDSAIKALDAPPEFQKQLRSMMDDLLQDLGARV